MMTSALEIWIKQATRDLSTDSAARVRTEILEHYELALEAALSAGSTAEAADQIAVTVLGDAATANRQYRQVLLTSAEARLLGDGNREARVVCSNPWVKPLLLSIPAAILLASLAFLLKGKPDTAKGLLEGAIAVAVWCASPFLPIYTRWRGRLLRLVKWAVLFAMIGMVYQWSWLFVSCLWPLAWIEWTRVSIRRKMPLSQWPKQLYL
jgi:hypothetical protein